MAGNGIKPSALANPIPGADLAASLTPQVMPMKPAPQADAPPVPMADPNMQAAPEAPQVARESASDPFEDAFNQPIAPSQSAQAPEGQDPFEAGFSAPLQPSVKMGMTGAALLSFADNDSERQKAVTKIYGRGAHWDPVQKVAISPTGQVIQPPDDGFMQGWIANPTGKLGSLARMGVETAAMVGTDAAALAAAPETLGASLTGLALSGAAGVSAKNLVKQTAGIFDQTSGEVAYDMAISAGGSVILGKAGEKILGSLATKVAEQHAAYTTADSALQITKAGIEDMATTLKEAQAAGFNIKPTASAFSTDPNVIKQDLKISDTKAYQDHMKVLQNTMSSWTDSLMNKLTGGAYAEAAEGRTGDIAKRAAAVIEGYNEREGAKIGLANKEIVAKAGSQAFEAPRLQQALMDLFTEHKAVNGAGTAIIGGIDREGMTTAERNLVSRVEAAYTDAFNNNGTLGAETMLDLYNGLKNTTSALFKQNSPMAGLASNIRRAAQDDFNEVGKKVGVDLATKFEGRANYAETLETMKTFSKVLKDDAIASRAFVGDMLTNKSAKQVFTARDVLSKLDPGLVQDMQGQFMNDLVNKHTSGNSLTSAVNYKGLVKDLENVGKQKMEAFFGEGSYDSLVRQMQALGTIQEKDLSRLSPAEQKNLVKSAISFASQPFVASTHYAANALNRIVNGKSEGKAALQLSKEIDLDALVKEIPKPLQSRASKVVEMVGKLAAPQTKAASLQNAVRDAGVSRATDNANNSKQNNMLGF